MDFAGLHYYQGKRQQQKGVLCQTFPGEDPAGSDQGTSTYSSALSQARKDPTRCPLEMTKAGQAYSEQSCWIRPDVYEVQHPALHSRPKPTLLERQTNIMGKSIRQLPRHEAIFSACRVVIQLSWVVPIDDKPLPPPPSNPSKPGTGSQISYNKEGQPQGSRGRVNLLLNSGKG